jgi:glycosyltransferase involved in cell wall biosynthesis
MTSISSQYEKKVVGIVVSSLENRGPVNVVRAQVAEESRGRFAYVVVVLGGEVDATVASEIKRYGAELVVIHAKGLIGKTRELAKIVHDFDISILHSHGATADLVNALVRSRVRKVTTVHNCLLEDYLPLFGRLKGTVYFFAHFLSYLMIANRIACSSAVGKALSKYFLEHRVIQNGVNTSVYRRLSPDEKAALRVKCDVAVSGFVYLYCGSFINRKNVEFLLRNLSLKENDVFVLAGEGELLEQCRQLVSGDARYRFVGQVRSCLELYQMCDYFVSASHSEGLPLAVLEAYSCGAALLLSDIPSHREVAAKCEDEVQLFQIGQATVIEVASAPIHGRSKALERLEFSASRMSAEYQNFYRELVGAGASEVSAQIGQDAWATGESTEI